MGDLERKLRELHVDELSIATLLQITSNAHTVSFAPTCKRASLSKYDHRDLANRLWTTWIEIKTASYVQATRTGGSVFAQRTRGFIT
jgi:hypothetical protein